MRTSDSKVAWVTGAGSGIGRAIAIDLATEGYALAVHDRDGGQARDAAAELKRFGHRAISYEGDVADFESNADIGLRIVRELGRLDCLVNNAARSCRQPFLDLPLEEFRKTWEVILGGSFHCSQIAARQMMKQKAGGAILMISSVHAAMAYPHAADYNSAKAGLNHLARTMAAELSAHRIRVNVIEPGWVNTPGERVHFSESEIAERGKVLPWGRLAAPAEIAKAASFLCSDRASYITGSTLRVDGGFVLPRDA